MNMKKLWLWVAIAVMALAVACSKDDTGSNGGGSDKPDEPAVENANIEGFVYDNNGAPLSGVVVSDGLQCVRTSKEGKFAFESDLGKTRFVFVVQPAGYKAVVEQGKAQFYKQLGKGDAQQINGVYRLRFTLDKISGNADRYTLVLAGDPQPRNRTYGYDKFAYHSLDCCDDMWRDMGEYKAGITDRDVYGIMLGDLVHEDMSLYADYLKGIASLGYPTYSVIGNHDNNPKATTDDAGAEYFEDNLGPRNYSLNLGKFHVIVLDNLIMKLNSSGELKDYNQGLTDDIWQWLQNDLKMVDYSTPLIVCAHSPMFRLASGSERWSATTTQHGADYANLLSKYKRVYAWAGHTHSTFNYVYTASSKLPNVECHTVGRVTGALWINEWLCDEGTPRGYVVAEVDGENISWQFKPIAYQSGEAVGETPAYKYRDIELRNGVFYRNGKKLDESYQLRAYPRHSYGDNDSYVYANVFMWDEQWGKVMFKPANGTTVEMTRVTDKTKMYDLAYQELFDFYKTNNSTLAGNSGFAAGTTTHLFRCYSVAQTCNGTITVTDRFGNEYSTTVKW